MKNISGLYRLEVQERIDALQESGLLDEAAANALRDGDHVLSVGAADRIIENVLGIFALPLAVAPNFVVNGKTSLVPLVVEEPSIVAALSAAARLATKTGGFEARCDESLLAGQVHITQVDDVDVALRKLDQAKPQLLNAANSVHPRLVARGGGVRDISLSRLDLPDHNSGITVTFHTDTCDAMGANLVNTICEALAGDITDICGGSVAMRILSNLADRSLVTSRVRYPVSALRNDVMSGEDLRDAIVLANDIAMSDPYRAATHNKGIMNGIDPLAIATANDWRAIEAGAHAYAAIQGQYRPLTTWSVDTNGDLLGEIQLPLKLGTVGGTLTSNPAAELCLGMTGAESATELAMLMASVGLAQNFAALRALASSGIQQGHMRLHARSLVASAGASPQVFEEAARKLVESGEIKDWKAREIVDELSSEPATEASAKAAGKVILLGEHGVVYGKHALAVPIANAVSANATITKAATCIEIPEWRVRSELTSDNGLARLVQQAIDSFPESGHNLQISVYSKLPRAMGLGSSAAIAVAVTRAIASALEQDLDDEATNRIAFACEKLAHGTPSGVDNTVATYAQPLLFRRGDNLEIRPLELAAELPLVVGFSHQRGLTHDVVAGVRQRAEIAAGQYSAIFDEMDSISLSGATAIQAGELDQLGLMMNICHGLLNAIEVSTPELERMVSIARKAGAIGAKLTGAGGGGSIVALCPGTQAAVQKALRQAGFDTLELTVR